MLQMLYRRRAPHQMSADELDAILKSARVNNKVLGVTGMLLYAQNTFYQILEGEKSTVLKLFDRIYSDPRHRGIWVMRQQMISQRDFPEWSMGFHRAVSEEELPAGFFDLSEDNLGKQAQEEASEAVLEFLRNFAQTRLSA